MNRVCIAALALLASFSLGRAQSGGAIVGAGGTPCTTTANSLQYDNSGAFGCVSGWTTNGTTTITNTQAPAANTSTDGLILTDTTAATSGNQQYSPRLRLTGQGWKASGTPASESSDWSIDNEPAQGTNFGSVHAPSKLVFGQQIAGGGYTSMFELANNDAYTYNLSGGVLTFTGINKINIGQASGGAVDIYNNGTLIQHLASTGAQFAVGLFPRTDAAVPLGAAPTGGFSGGWNNLFLSTAAAIAFNNDTFITRPGVATLQHGAADTTGATAPTAQTIQMQSSTGGASATDIAGGNFSLIGSRGTGAGTSGNVVIKVGKTLTTGTTQHTAYPMLSVNPGNATGATIQFGDGTNFTTYDSCTALTTGATGVVACTASAMRFKIPEAQLAFASVEDGINKLRAATWTYKPEFQKEFGSNGEQHVSLYADDVEKMDKRCVTYDHGSLKDYSDRCVVAYLVAEVQNLKSQLAQLRK